MAVKEVAFVSESLRTVLGMVAERDLGPSFLHLPFTGSAPSVNKYIRRRLETIDMPPESAYASSSMYSYETTDNLFQALEVPFAIDHKNITTLTKKGSNRNHQAAPKWAQIARCSGRQGMGRATCRLLTSIRSQVQRGLQRLHPPQMESGTLTKLSSSTTLQGSLSLATLFRMFGEHLIITTEKTNYTSTSNQETTSDENAVTSPPTTTNSSNSNTIDEDSIIMDDDSGNEDIDNEGSKTIVSADTADTIPTKADTLITATAPGKEVLAVNTYTIDPTAIAATAKTVYGALIRKSISSPFQC
ncbi:MAG: hypothetical protein J3R72DRAFT_488740 [Linnemannia gamsii]|nr:MAG: hypothetical protein J3R72DRAFT_488740 [Linnemannia gamsii]